MMDPAFALKLFTDVFLFLGVAGLFAPSMEMALPLMGAAALATLSMYLYERNAKTLWRILVLVPMLVFLKDIHSGGDAFLLLSPMAYLMFTAATGRFSVEREGFISYAKPIFCFLIVGIPAGILFDEGSGRTLSNALPAAGIALILAILLLRTLRHSPATRRELRFILLNFALPVGSVLAAFLLSKAGLLNLLGDGLGLAYDKVLLPILLGISYAMFAVVWGFQKVFSLLFQKQIASHNPDFKIDLAPEDAQLGIEASEGSALAGQILMALGILIGGFVLFLLFRAMLGARAERPNMENSGARSLTDAPDAPRSARSIFSLPTPREQVRRSFKKTLRLAADAGIEILPSDTSESVCQNASVSFDKDALMRLRALYIRARYSENEITRTDAKEAKRLSDEIKKSRVKESK